jgi:hypothetical protein
MPHARKTPPRRRPRLRHAWPLLLLGGAAGAQTSTPEPAAAAANQQVLDAWQQRTGQQARLDDQGVVQLQVQLGVDVYVNDLSTAAADPRLVSSVREGRHARLTLTADWRRSDAAQRTAWVQGLVNASDDRATQPRYAAQIGSFQAGYAGPGYRYAFGDVVASFSHLSSNLGLRGVQAALESERLAVQGFAGTVAESWEALGGRRPRDGQPARLQPLRDVVGVKADWRLAGPWAAFATVQSYADRADAALPQAQRLAGTAASIGLRYAGEATQLQAEWARARRDVRQQPAFSSLPDTSRDAAWLLSLAHRSGNWQWRAGAHDFGVAYASLAQTAAPGLREGYVGVDVNPSPALGLSVELRDALTRSAASAFGASSQSLQTLTQRIHWRPASWPGWSFGLSDMRNRGRDAAGLGSRQASTQLSAGRSTAGGSLQAVLGHSSQQAAGGARSRSSQWQLQVGRQHTLGADGAGALSWQAQAQQQRQVTAAPWASSNLSSTLGANLAFSERRFGQWALAAQWQRIETRQAGTAAAPALDSRSLSLDWTLPPMAPGFSARAFVRVQQRNVGDARLRVDERSIGIQGVRQW